MEERARASLFDGETALRHRVHLRLDGDALLVEERGERVPLAELRPVGDRSRALYARAGSEGWRLAFEFPLPPWIGRLPRQEHHGGLLDRFGVPLALLAGVLITAAVVIAAIGATGLLARAIPERWEVALGDAAGGAINDEICRGRAGQAALDRLARRLAPDGAPIRVEVVDWRLENAATLPGRQILIFRGLLEQAAGPDEIAGVLGHEIGHVVRRDAIVSLFRQLGLSLIVGGADGGAIARTLIDNRYSRSAERDSDAHAIQSLAAARISPAGAAAFFDRMRRHEGALGDNRVVGYLSTHPMSAERSAAFRAAAQGRDWTPAMSAADWTALRGICGKPR